MALVVESDFIHPCCRRDYDVSRIAMSLASKSFVGYLSSFLQPSTVMAVFGLFLFKPSSSIQALQIA
jgi:hypothetical protein